MGKKKVVVALVLLLSTGFVFATGAKEVPSQAAGASGSSKGIGTASSPVKVTYMCKDVDPITDADQLGKLEALIEQGMAKEGNYVDLEILSAPTGSYKTVVPIAFRTGQIAPDLVYFQGNDQPLALDGLLEDLTPYVEKSTNVKAIMPDQTKAALKNYPYLMWLAPARVQIPVMRSDWFASLKSSKALLENPSVDAYYALFKEMKESGLCQWPITTDGGILKLDSVFNHAFGITATIVKENGTWVYSDATMAAKNKLAFYAKLYADGLLDNEYVTKTWDTMEQAFYEGTAGFVAGTAGDVVNVYNNKMKETQGVDLAVLPPAKGISQAYQSIDVTKESRGFAMSSGSPVKDAAWAVLEYMAGPDGRKLDKLGLEGIHYTVQNGKYVLTDKFPSWWAKFWPTMNGLDLSKVEGDVLSAPAIKSLDEAAKYFAPDTNVLLPEDLLPLKDAMDKLYREYSTDIIRGVRPVSDFDEFVVKWNKAGGTEISKYLATVLN
ncbi:ABC-type sugar transport system, periplasmic component [Sphaerochaeta pleomorpha str. Grapes]|uniref:ABC-type sugar transport system, periplasmic component n=1 Tax=Sphaerochaeta pleomorpha (strain ATCC BAA-1885 / DSM 22778 / Grapes) TaxID=158190 RepID=G8QV21_SPHPG|nr:extracellular solute-binding protein [Sphaerochaeta pleomorpha]AEV29257.1 ABC-type sugar transport system, periplasmic component [Sphaerochaeta pleomorpha str. Grapes]